MQTRTVKDVMQDMVALLSQAIESTDTSTIENTLAIVAYDSHELMRSGVNDISKCSLRTPARGVIILPTGRERMTFR